MTLFTKICGITDREAAITAANAGASAIGLVFAESPRRVEVGVARRIADAVRGQTSIVAVFRKPMVAQVVDVVEKLEPDLVQADHRYLPELATPVLPVYREGDSAVPAGGLFVFEGLVSGIGRRVSRQAALAMRKEGDMVLAGGLSPVNVAQVVADIRPFGVDVSTGVETEPGVKSPALIESFLARATYAAEGLVVT